MILIYIEVRGLKPSENYKGVESGFKNRAKEIIYYKTLNTFSTFIFPFAILLNMIGRFLKLKTVYALLTEHTRFTSHVLGNPCIAIILIFTITLIISKIYTRCKVNISIKKGELHKHIGEHWIDTSI